MEKELATFKGKDSKAFVRFPGVNRYHFTYTKLVDEDLVDLLPAKRRKEAFLGLDALLASKEEEIYKLREQTWSLMQELEELRELSGSEMNKHAAEEDDMFF